jgi:alkylated DNA repair dioxygenase AlkB
MRAMATDQPGLFDLAPPLPPGMRYAQDFLTAAEEAALVAHFAGLDFHHAEYLQYTARRRIVSYGGRYDFSQRELRAAEAIPDWLLPLRDRAAAWAGLEGPQVRHALIAEYAPGTPLGWHRDVPDFEAIVGVSLGSRARMRFRRYPPRKPGRSESRLELAPRSIYTLQGESRWGWQHAVSPTKELRWSITFRTLRTAA